MNGLERLLYESGILKLSKNKIRAWGRQAKRAHLIFAAHHGLYDIRLETCNHFKAFATEDKVEKTLIMLANDDVEIVGDAAIEVLKSKTNGRHNQLMQQVKEKRARIKAQEDKLRENARRSRDDFPSLGGIYGRSRGRNVPDLNAGFGGIGIDGGFGF